MFAGESAHSLDAKGRVVVPRRLLDSISGKSRRGKLYLTLGVDGCLFLFTAAQFRKVEADLSPFLFGNKNARRFQRLFFSHVRPVEPDGQSRVLIPDTLKQIAGIEKEVVFVGCGNRIEVWASGAWRGFKKGNLSAFDELADVICGAEGRRPSEERRPGPERILHGGVVRRRP